MFFVRAWNTFVGGLKYKTYVIRLSARPAQRMSSPALRVEVSGCARYPPYIYVHLVF